MLAQKAIPALGERRFETLLLAAAGVFYAAAAYLPWGWPSADGYPAVERYIDHGFLPDDFYTNTTTVYNVDTLLSAALKAAQEATGVRYDVIMAALNIVRCFAFPFVLFGFFRALSGDRRIAAVGALLGAASLYALPNLFAWGWLWGDPSPAMFALLFITGGWTYFLRRQPAMAMAAFSLAVMIHPLMAVHGGLFAALIFFFDYSSEEKVAALRSPAAWLAGLLFGGLFAFQYLLLGGTPDDRLPVDVYTRILAWVRHPADFLPSRFPAADWIAGIASSAAAALIVWKMRGEFHRPRLMIAGLASYFAVCITGWLLVEVYPVRFFVELIPFRYVIVGAPLMLFAYAVFAAAEMRDGRWASFAVVALVFLAATPATRIQSAQAIPSLILAAWIALRVLTNRPAAAPIDSAAASRVTPRTAMAALAALIAVLSPVALYARRHELVIPRAENQHPLYAWAKSETPPDAIFLVDQNGDYSFSRAIDPQRMRLVGRRAVAASKDFPFLDHDMVPWNDRWGTALGGGAHRFVSAADADTLVSVAATVPFDYVVRDEPLDDPRFALAASFGPAKGAPQTFVYKLER